MLAVPAKAQSCVPQNAGLPPLTGRMVYEDFGGPVPNDPGAIYIYDFLSANTCTMPALIPTASMGLSAPTNPVFSPDGQAIVFSAVAPFGGPTGPSLQRHIYYWAIGAAYPRNLTLSMGNQRFEDVKFSPDGAFMMWKQAGDGVSSGGIWKANFGFDPSGEPQLTNPVQLVTGIRNSATEASGPTFSPDANHIYYFTGSGSFPPQQIEQYSLAGQTSGLAFSPQSSLNYYYYPVVDFTSGKLLYVGAPIGGRDKIFYFPNANAIDAMSIPTTFNAGDTGSDDSDPAPVDGDHFIYSRDNNTGNSSYALYLGQLSTGMSWSLSPLNINVPNTSLRGATYTAIRPTISSIPLVVYNSGSGTVTSTPTGTSCGPLCFAAYPPWTSVTLTATPAAGFTFGGWTGICTGTGTCTVTMYAALNVFAHFSEISPPPSAFVLAITKSGTGSVTSTPSGIDCGATCWANFASGASVILNAAPASGYSFAGWSGACGGTGDCVMTMNAAQNVTALFSQNPVSYSLTINTSGSGSVSSAPSGIDCGGICSASFAANTQVTLTPTPVTGYRFLQWSSACGGTGNCVVTMDSAKSVAASFLQNPPTATLTVSTNGSGKVISSTGEIDCGAVCSAQYQAPLAATLTATPADSFTFTGWSGACGGTGTCYVTGGSQSVTATFTQNPTSKPTFALSVSAVGSGTVTSSPAGINCTPTCTSAFTGGTPVSLTVTSASGFAFAGWGGACSGQGTCIVTMNAAQTVSASFVQGPSSMSPLFASVLPASRSATVNSTVTAFATIINSGASAVHGCAIAPIGGLPVDFTYQSTNSLTNALFGNPNTPMDIAANSSKSYVIALTPTAAFAPTALNLSFACSDVPQSSIHAGLNTLLLSASATPVPDIVALVATLQNDGIAHLAGTTNQGSGVFAVATVNLGTVAAITATANTGGVSLPLDIKLCQTNPTTGICISPMGVSTTLIVNNSDTPTFAVFIDRTGPITFDPANSRITVQFADSNGAVRGETSVAVQSQ
jgi:uncharacterized repeat protein (TIGR02543 family)